MIICLHVNENLNFKLNCHVTLLIFFFHLHIQKYICTFLCVMILKKEYLYRLQYYIYQFSFLHFFTSSKRFKIKDIICHSYNNDIF